MGEGWSGVGRVGPWTGSYLPQVDAHDHPHLGVGHQGADRALAGKLNNPDLRKANEKLTLKMIFFLQKKQKNKSKQIDKTSACERSSEPQTTGHLGVLEKLSLLNWKLCPLGNQRYTRPKTDC